MTQLWHCKEEEVLSKLKNSRRLDYKNVLKNLHALQVEGWQLIERQINYEFAKFKLCIHSIKTVLLTCLQNSFLDFAAFSASSNLST